MNNTTLVIPDAHVGPEQDLSRFAMLGQLIVDRRPDRIITMGDFVSLESLSNWDLNKSGVMEGRRYQNDIAAGNMALDLLFFQLRNLQDKQRRLKERVYKPRIVYIYGNHEDRLVRYLETRAELKEHLNLDDDLNLLDHGFHDIIPYRQGIEFDGVNFTHSLMNMANQAVSGRYAIHRAAEMTAKSLVFAHSHRRENVNYYRHGADNILQILMCGAFFEHVDDYAYGGLNAYWRGVNILTHWAEGRFDVEEISIERLRNTYEDII